jgi:AcrR family transcriptional regulator
MTAMSPKSNDPRSRKTRLSLQCAFMELVPQHGFEAVSIAMIAERADKNRATFYKYYGDKFELLRDCMIGWIEDYSEGIDSAPPEDIEEAFPQFLFDIVQHYMEQRKFYVAILDDGRFPAFHSLFSGTLKRRFAQLIEYLRKSGKADRNSNAERLAVFISYACYGILVDWLRNGDESRTKKDCEAFSSIMLKILRG